MTLRPERNRNRARTWTGGARLVVAAGALALAASACGGSHSSSTNTTSTTVATTTTSVPPSSSGSASGGATAAITKSWETFFNGKTPTSERVALLQDGTQFEAIISSQASSPLAASAGAKVTDVVLVTPTEAKVTYAITEAGATALPGQSGTAVLESGTWKVGVSSFCGLLALESGGKTTGLPAACSSAG